MKTITILCYCMMTAFLFSQRLTIQEGTDQGSYLILERDEWNITDTLELETNTILLGNTMILHPGAKILTHGNHLRLLIREKIQAPQLPAPMTTPHLWGLICTTEHGSHAKQPGEHGSSGKGGNLFIVCPQISGYLIMDTRGGNGGHGQDGLAGKNGEDGLPGQDGEDAKYFILQTGPHHGHLYFTHLPTPGLPGSKGKQGQNGQAGGSGGAGADGGYINIIANQIHGGQNSISTGGIGGQGGTGGQGGQGGHPGRHGRSGRVLGLDQLPMLEWEYYQVPYDIYFPLPQEIKKLIGKKLQRQTIANPCPPALIEYWKNCAMARLYFQPRPIFPGTLANARTISRAAFKPNAAPPNEPGSSGRSGDPGASGSSGKSGKVLIPVGIKIEWIQNLLTIEIAFAQNKIDENQWREYRKNYKKFSGFNQP